MATTLLVLLAALFASALAFLAATNFRRALFIFVLLLPSYLIRFNIGPLPTTLLEISFGAIFLVWLVKFAHADWLNIRSFFSQNKFFAAALAVFFIASVAGIFVSDMWWYSLGQWRAYFLEPMLFFIILLGQKNQFSGHDLALALGLSGLSVALVALIQTTTGSIYPPSLWDDALSGRATSFFTSPNAVGLYLGPIFLLLLGLWLELKTTSGNRHLVSMLFGLLGLALLGLISAQSLGAFLGLSAGALIFAYLAGHKKIATAVIMLGVLILLLPQSRLLLAGKAKSIENRLTLWRHSGVFLTASPKNFIFGAGIRQYFRKVEKPYYNPVELERLIYPHNIFLNFWSEVGLMGMLSFGTLFVILVLQAVRAIKNKFSYFAIGLAAALAAFFVHGLIDVPYFKNDLAFLFWIIATLVMHSPTPSRAAAAQAASGERSKPTVSDSALIS